MSENLKVNRRDFLKLGSLAAVSLPAITKVGRMGSDDLLASPEAYGGFLVRTLAADEAPIEVDEANYQRFDATNAIFSRQFWDTAYSEKVNNVELVYQAGQPGYKQFDAALTAGDTAPIRFTEVEKVVLPAGQVSPQDAGELIKAELETWEGAEIKAFLLDVIENTDPDKMPAGAPPAAMVKVMPAGQFKGMLSTFTTMPTPMLAIFAEKLDLEFEIANVDPGESARPRYLADGTLAIPETMQTVIVLAFEMDHDAIAAAPTTLSNAASLDGYSKMAITAGSVAQFIRGLGYNAIPCGNNTGIIAIIWGVLLRRFVFIKA